MLTEQLFRRQQPGPHYYQGVMASPPPLLPNGAAIVGISPAELELMAQKSSSSSSGDKSVVFQHVAGVMKSEARVPEIGADYTVGALDDAIPRHHYASDDAGGLLGGGRQM